MKKEYLCRFGRILAGCLFCMLISFSACGIVYVDMNASGSNDGTSWANAYNSIQSGINDEDAPTTDIWVADGTYYEGITITSILSITTTMDVITITIPITTTIQGIHLYGGFEGYGGAEETERDQRDWVTNVTTIDSDGAYHTVSVDNVTSSIIDGFFITGGNAHGTGLNNYGGGVHYLDCDQSNSITNCVIADNEAYLGGGISCFDSSPSISKCRILYNYGDHGGGIHCSNSSPDIVNCVFNNNGSFNGGGGIYCFYGSSPLVQNCTFSSNGTNVHGSGVLAYGNGSAANPMLRNCIFESHYLYAVYELDDLANISLQYNLFYNSEQGAFYDYDTNTYYMDYELDAMNAEIPEADGNIYGDPMFVNKYDNDFHLLPCSSAAIDEGTSVTAPIDDLDWNPRPVDYPGRGRDGAGEGYDIGAYELQQTDPDIAVDPLYINFGDQSVNQGPTDPQLVTIWNNGSADLVFNYITLGNDTDFGFATEPITTTLGICMSRTIEVVFDPTQIGGLTTTLVIATNDPISSTITVELEGNGVNQPPTAGLCDGGVNPYALDFDGENDWVDCGNDSSLNPPTQLTVEAWINADVWENYSWEGSIVDKHTDVSGFDGYVLRVGGNGRVSFNIALDTWGWFEVLSPQIMSTGTWYHIAGTYDGSYSRVYINGVQQNVRQNTYGHSYSPDSSYNVRIGDGTEYTGRMFNGKIDEVRIWNVARSQTDILNNMNITLLGNEPGLVACWHFNEGAGSTAYDSTANLNHGTLYGMPDWTTNTPEIELYDHETTTDENMDTTLTLCGSDPDDDDLTAWVTQLPAPGTGALYQFAGPGPVRGALIDTVPALVTDPDLQVVFAPQDTPFNYNALMKWKVNDGFVDSANQASYIIHVLDNDPPELVKNGPFSLAKGDTLHFTSGTLFATDYEDLPANILYHVTDPPMHGTLNVNSAPLEDDTFSQGDINNGLVSYVHSSIGMAQDHFHFTLSDSANLVGGPYTTTIDIIFTPAPQVYVDLNSPGPVLDGGSWASAHHSVRIGVLDAEALGLTEVWVANGTYEAPVDMRTDVHALAGFEGYGGAEETMASQRDWIANICTIVSTERNQSTVTMDGITGSLVHGFIITGNGVSINGTNDTNEITSCTIAGNTAQSGGGIYCHQSSPIVTDCIITENAATREGGGIYARNNSSPLFVNCEITSNTAEEVGGGIYSRNSAGPNLVNCVIALNSAAQGGALHAQNQAEPMLINCTVSGNRAELGGGVYALSKAAPVLINTIFEDNSNYAIYEADDNTNISAVDSCLFWNNADGAYYDHAEGGYTDAQVADMNADLPEAENNITGDPKFADKEKADFHLTACSAALDMGAAEMAPSFDKDDLPRPVDLPDIGKDGEGEGFDIGAYEYQLLAPKIKASPNPLDFGGQLVNQGPANPKSVTIFNEGTLPLEISSITLEGSSDFTFVQDPVTTGLAVCAGFDVEIGFDPSSTGLITATLEVESNDPDQPVFEVEILGMGLNAPPVAGIPGPGGDQFALNTDENTAKMMMLTGWDPDNDPITFWVSQLPAEGYGEIYQYQGPGMIRGPRIGTVPTLVTDPLLRLIFVPSNRSASYETSLLWKVNDGYEDSLNQGTFTITVLADDDPAVLVNSSMTVNENSTTPLTPDDLLATGDEPVIFRMNSVTLNGQILLNSIPLGVGDTFTQVDVGLGRLAYAQDGSETTMDMFLFSFQDENSGWIAGNDFMITIEPVNDLPVLEINSTLDAVQGRRRVIPATHLLVTDEESGPAEILFTIATTPAFGNLNLNNTPLGVGGTFTQADIDAGIVTYRNTGSGLDPDSFTFTYSDGSAVLGPETFNLNIIEADTRGAWWMLR